MENQDKIEKLKRLHDEGKWNNEIAKFLKFINFNYPSLEFVDPYTIRSTAIVFTDTPFKNFPLTLKSINQLEFSKDEGFNDQTLSIVVPKVRNLYVENAAFKLKESHNLHVEDIVSVLSCEVDNFKNLLAPGLRVEKLLISSCNVVSLEGCPSRVKTVFEVEDSTLETLKFMPEMILKVRLIRSTVKSGWLYPFTSKIGVFDEDSFIGAMYNKYNNIYDAASYLIEHGFEKEAEL